ncbi:MAG: HipA domain-containing protein [Gammaproteobacteria bacterium]|nr:HipA domain-containing protein [Gammaproteobacteria bacterium]
MKHCPITYEVISDEETYSQRGLHILSAQLNNLYPLTLNADEQRQEAVARVGKMSIQGVQTKFSAQLKIKEERFEMVDQQGHFILKPQSEYYAELPENEAITMTLAATIGLEVPVHGLVYSKDNSMTYFIKRFDRIGHNKKLALEDFAQLLGVDRYTKYESSMEKVISVISTYCTFPKIEFVKLFKLTVFNFLIGNEDMHLKNFSLLTRDQLITLSPAYDLLNTTIAQKDPKEETALPLNGKKRNFKKKDFLEYLAIERLGLNQNVIQDVTQTIQRMLPTWRYLIGCSFLSQAMQEKYMSVLEERCQRLGLINNG